MKIFSFFLCINFFPLVGMEHKASQECNNIPNNQSLKGDAKDRPVSPTLLRVQKQSLRMRPGFSSVESVNGDIVDMRKSSDNSKL